MQPEKLADAIARLTEWAEEHAPEPEPPVRRRLREHFGRDPAELPVVVRPLAGWDRPNFQVAIDGWSAGRDVEVVGLPVMQGYRAGLAELVRGPDWVSELELGAVEHMPVPLGEHESVLCVKSGFWLVHDAEGPAVVMLKSEDRGMGESGCARAGDICVAGCCSTVPRAPARRSPPCTSRPRCRAERRCC